MKVINHVKNIFGPAKKPKSESLINYYVKHKGNLFFINKV